MGWRARVAEPRFSVITPSYQQGPYIERTLRSVLDQQFEALEYFVMDGGSTDQTVSILQRYGDQLWWQSAADDGQADAVNLGLERTRGEFIGWLNSDDVYYAGTLKVVAEYFDQHPEIDIVYGNADHIDENDQFLESYPTEPWDPERLLETCYLCQPATFFRRRVVEQWGELNRGLNFCMDYEFWLRLSAGGARFGYLRRRLAGSRLYPETKTLGHRVAFHAEINRMTQRLHGRVPDRWLANWATEVQRRWGWGEEGSPGHYRGVALVSWFAALYWNRTISRQHRQWIATWLETAKTQPALETSEPELPAVEQSQPGRLVPRNGSPEGLRIGFDVSQTGPGKSGCGWFANGLLDSASAQQDNHLWLLYRSFGDHYWDASGPPPVERFLRPNVQEGTFHRSPAEMRRFWRQPPADFEQRLGAPDIVHANNFFAPRRLEHARLVYTLYDLIFLHHPELTSEANRLACFGGVVGASQHADWVMAISETSRLDFLDTFPSYPADRTAVVYPSNRFAGWVSTDDGLPTQLATVEARLLRHGFWLTVGDRGPRKNRQRILEAFTRHRSRASTERTLVLVGGGDDPDPEFDARVAALGVSNQVVCLGYVDDTALAWLYEHAFGFIFPSIAEGFGMPVVEAMGFGAPVVTSELEIFKEVAGDAALRVDPMDPAAIADAMDRLDGDAHLHRTLSALGRVRARRFAPQRSAAALITAYEEVVRRSKFCGLGLRSGDPVPLPRLD